MGASGETGNRSARRLKVEEGYRPARHPATRETRSLAADEPRLRCEGPPPRGRAPPEAARTFTGNRGFRDRSGRGNTVGSADCLRLHLRVRRESGPWRWTRPQRLDRRDEGDECGTERRSPNLRMETGVALRREQGATHTDCARSGCPHLPSRWPSAQVRLRSYRGRRALEGKKAQGGQAIACWNTANDGTDPHAEQSLEGDASCRWRRVRRDWKRFGWRMRWLVRGKRQEGNGRGDTVRLRVGGVLRGAR